MLDRRPLVLAAGATTGVALSVGTLVARRIRQITRAAIW
jgi:hypothetical protein